MSDGKHTVREDWDEDGVRFGVHAPDGGLVFDEDSDYPVYLIYEDRRRAEMKAAKLDALAAVEAQFPGV